MYICKYLNQSGLLASVSDEDVMTVKFSKTSSYNDPFELYLEPDAGADEFDRAAFDVWMSRLPDLPVSCFSRNCNSTVMWAHYASDRTGACLIFDEDEFCSSFDLVGVGDVGYVESFPQDHQNSLRHAMGTGKPRHMHFALNGALRAAYFTKSNHWAYEEERRLVVNNDEVNAVDGSLLLKQLPYDALQYIVTGDSASAEVLDRCKIISEKHSIPLYKISFSRMLSVPYFIEIDGSEFYEWVDGDFVLAGSVCGNCGEPNRWIENGACDYEACPWCEIEDGTKSDAYVQNAYFSVLEGITDYESLSLPGKEHKGSMVDKERKNQKDKKANIVPLEAPPNAPTEPS